MVKFDILVGSHSLLAVAVFQLEMKTKEGIVTFMLQYIITSYGNFDVCKYSGFLNFQKCLNGHIVYKWVSQPVLNRGLHGGDLLSAAAIVASGNNFAKIALFAKFMKLNFLGSNTFTNIQRQYVVPSIEELWESKQQNVIRTCRNQDLVILGRYRFTIIHYMHGIIFV